MNTRLDHFMGVYAQALSDARENAAARSNGMARELNNYAARELIGILAVIGFRESALPNTAATV